MQQAVRCFARPSGADSRARVRAGSADTSVAACGRNKKPALSGSVQTLSLNFCPMEEFSSTDQVLNLVPWGGVALRLPPVALADAEGAEEVSRRVADAYISDIVMHQVAATARRSIH